MKTGRVESFGDIALVQVTQRGEGIQGGIKRFCDVITAVAGLLALSPLLAILAALVKLTSRGPVIFRQERVGLGGRTFVLYKFRTMVADAEEGTVPVLAAARA